MDGWKNAKRHVLSLASGAILGIAGLVGCGQELPKRIVEFPGPWQVLDPGPSPKPLQYEVITPGKGIEVAPGDLVQIRVFTQSTDKKTLHDRGDWWVWMGFRSPDETPFFNSEPTLASSLLGMKQGTVFEFIEARSGIGSGPQYAGKLGINPLGDREYYSWRKYDNKFVTVFIADVSGGSSIEVLRVFKGKTQYRTIRLYDDSPVRVGLGYETWISREPREMWVDEVKITAVSEDGRVATFEFGPIPTRGKEAHTVVTGYFDRWFMDAWDKKPPGVQVK